MPLHRDTPPATPKKPANPPPEPDYALDETEQDAPGDASLKGKIETSENIIETDHNIITLSDQIRKFGVSKIVSLEIARSDWPVKPWLVHLRNLIAKGRVIKPGYLVAAFRNGWKAPENEENVEFIAHYHVEKPKNKLTRNERIAQERDRERAKDDDSWYALLPKKIRRAMGV